MAPTCPKDYASLDVPEVLVRLFYPRPELGAPVPPAAAREVLIPVAPGVAIGGRFHAAGPAAPTLLFFHGNGEIVADYDDLGPIYQKLGLNFFPVDYRGYGRSTGTPTASALLQDSHTILAFVRDWLGQLGFSGPLIVMGRSLGSAPALELGACHQDDVDGLIIESGFAYTGPLLQVLGVDVQALGFEEAAGFGNLDKIRTWRKPLLVIHAQFDQIIPLAEGQTLYEASPSPAKTLLQVEGADHNDILSVGFSAYLEAVAQLGALARGRKHLEANLLVP